MIKRGESKRSFLSRNHTIVTAVRHKQKKARLVLSNKKDLNLIVRANVIVFVNATHAFINYKKERTAIPSFAINLSKLNDQKEKNIK